ncbi:hypothetical protein MSPP1_002251 [Malassezia sp. CBS 17886]|nr:hypothetical protein MSPP1_002251 [Malassezia sp. CBS 17886]
MASGAAGARGRGGRRGAVTDMMRATGSLYADGAPVDDAAPTSLPSPAGVPVLDRPSAQELVDARMQLEFVRAQADSPYWFQTEAPRHLGRDVPRFSDRYLAGRGAPPTAVSFLEAVPLQKAVFPSQLWANFTSSETKRERRARRIARERPTATIDWENLQMEEKRAGGDAEEDGAPESEEEDLGNYEDEEDDDYAQNYFDNGEDDDYGDGDGGDGGGDEAAFD